MTDNEREQARSHLERELTRLCADLSPIEQALLIASAMREVYGGARLEMHADGRFAVIPEER